MPDTPIIELLVTYLPIAIIATVLRSIRWNWLYFLIIWPGTVLHETCHFVVGLATNGDPTSFDVFPQRSPSGYTLGSVGFRHITWYNGVLIGMAPLLIWIGIWLAAPARAGMDVRSFLYWGISGLLFYSGIPSRTDFKVALKSVYPILVVVAIGLGFWLRG
jgi:hypothetical protein